MSKIFEVDFKRLVALALPVELRKPKLFALIKAATRPLVQLYDLFLSNRAANIYTVNITPQVCYLRKMLNDNFDITARRLYVANGVVNDWHFAYSYSTDPDMPLVAGKADSTQLGAVTGSKVLVYNNDNEGLKLISKQGDIGTTGFDFYVMIPFALRGLIDENRVKSLINYYKLASKRYAIQYY